MLVGKISPVFGLLHNGLLKLPNMSRDLVSCGPCPQPITWSEIQASALLLLSGQMLPESCARQSQSEAPVGELRTLLAQETMFSSHEYANPEASQLLWCCVPYPVAADSLPHLCGINSWHIWHNGETFWIPYSVPPTHSCDTHPMSAFLKGDNILSWERFLYFW